LQLNPKFAFSYKKRIKNNKRMTSYISKDEILPVLEERSEMLVVFKRMFLECSTNKVLCCGGGGAICTYIYMNIHKIQK